VLDLTLASDIAALGQIDRAVTYFPGFQELLCGPVQQFDSSDLHNIPQHSAASGVDHLAVIYATLGEHCDSVPVRWLENWNGSGVVFVSAYRSPGISETKKFKKVCLPTSYTHLSKIIPDIKDDLEQRVLSRRFLSLNFRAKWPRQALLQFLCSHDMMHQFYFSYWGHPMHPYQSRDQYEINNEVIGRTWFNQNLDLDSLYHALPVTTDLVDDFEPDRDRIPALHLTQSADYGSAVYWQTAFGSVVCESNFNTDPEPTLTEKTFKCISYGHPFLLLASHGTLGLLHELGFETFGDVIDESYDVIESPQERLEQVFREIQRLCALSDREVNLIFKKLIPRLKQNQRLFRQDLALKYQQDIEAAAKEVNFWKQDLISNVAPVTH